MAAHTPEERETIFLANVMVDEQPSPEARYLRDKVRMAEVACGDCDQPHLASRLDLSTGLCEVCNEVAGLENELQDGHLTASEFTRLAKALGYKGKAL